MKVTITEIQNPSDALAALGLTRWLADLNIDSDIAGVPLEISRKMLSADMGGGCAGTCCSGSRAASEARTPEEGRTQGGSRG